MVMYISDELYDKLIQMSNEPPRPMTPKMRELLEAGRASTVKTPTAVDRVLALHQSEDEDDVDETMDVLCIHCSFVWPCPTVLAVQGK